MTLRFEELVTGADIGRALGVSRQRIKVLTADPEFPDPLGRLGQSLVWRWSDVEAWLERSRHSDRPELRPVLEWRLRQIERLGLRVEVDRVGEVVKRLDASRPELRPALERRLRQLERLGYEVEVDRDDVAGGVGADGGDFPSPTGDYYATISMRGWGSVGSEPGAESYDEAVESVLARFDRRKGSELADRDLRAREWELRRRGCAVVEGLAVDSMGEWHTCEVILPNGQKLVGKALSPREAVEHAVAEAEASLLGGEHPT